MTNLLKSDLRRIVRDKLFLTICILEVVFSVLTPLLYAAIAAVVGDLGEMLLSFTTSKANFFNAFSPTNNLGMIAPILFAVILFKDFSYGTVRNKIIGGNSRGRIFTSMFVSCAASLVAVMLVHAFLTLGVSLIFFDYQSTPFTADDFWYTVVSLLFEVLVYLFVAAVTTFLCVSLKNVGLVIVLSIAVTLLFSIVSGVLAVSSAVLQVTEPEGTALKVIDFFQRLNIYNFGSVIGMGESYATSDVLYLTLTPVIATAALFALGYIVFKKKDLK